jgi:hypothetical protein
VGLHGKRPSGVSTSTGNIPPDAASANVVIASVRDTQLDDTIDEIAVAAADGRISRGSVILHTSASAEPTGLRSLSGAGYPTGTFARWCRSPIPEISAEFAAKGVDRHRW